MQGRLYKNVHNRTLFKKYEVKKKIYKFLIHNRQNNIDLEFETFLTRKQNLIKKHASLSSIRNLCFLTSKARSTYRDFRLNRNMIKVLATQKLIPGLKKASW